MSKNLFARVPPHTYENLVTYCLERTVATGQRVSMRAVVERALEAYLAKGKSEQPAINC
jgi:hypothetical protein